MLSQMTESFFSWVSNIPFIYIYIYFFHSFMNGHFSYFHVSAIVNTAAVNMEAAGISLVS